MLNASSCPRSSSSALSWQEEDQLMMSNLTGLPVTTMGPSRLASAVGAGVMLLFFLEGMLGNLWIVVAVISKRHVWNIINLFIASLCFNELLVGVLTVSFIIDSYIWREWTAGELMCKLGPEFTIAFTGCSLWHTAFIAIHRYIVVVHNNAYKRMSKKAYVTFVLVVARLIPFAVTFPGFSLQTSGYVPKLLRCIILPNQGARMITITMVQIVAPCIIVVLCYACVFGYVLKIARQVNNSNMMMQREIQITKMFGVIFLMIMLGFIPYAAVRNADRGNELHADVYVIVTVCYGIATCSSPLIYGTMSTEIRSVCMTCLRQSCIFTGALRCMPCAKLLDRARSLSSPFSTATLMAQENQAAANVIEVEVKDAQTQIEGGMGEKFICLKEVNGHRPKSAPPLDLPQDRDMPEQVERLLKTSASSGDVEEQSHVAGVKDKLGSGDGSMCEMGDRDVNGEPSLMQHKQISSKRVSASSSSSIELDSDMLDSSSLILCSDTEVKMSGDSNGRIEVKLISNGSNKIAAV